MIKYAVEQRVVNTYFDSETDRVHQHQRVARLPAHNKEHAQSIVEMFRGQPSIFGGKHQTEYSYEVVACVHTGTACVWLALDDIERLVNEYTSPTVTD